MSIAVINVTPKMTNFRIIEQDHDFSINFMFIITKVGNKIIIRRTFRRDKSMCLSFLRGMHFLIFHILKVFGSKRPIELEGLSFCYPKNME